MLWDLMPLPRLRKVNAESVWYPYKEGKTKAPTADIASAVGAIRYYLSGEVKGLLSRERSALEGCDREGLALSLKILLDVYLVVLDECLLKEGIFLVVLLECSFGDMLDDVLRLTCFTSLITCDR